MFQHVEQNHIGSYHAVFSSTFLFLSHPTVLEAGQRLRLCRGAHPVGQPTRGHIYMFRR